ncbi:MAG: hypothetical protein AAF485_19795 [Chloroflexota bacterium]
MSHDLRYILMGLCLACLPLLSGCGEVLNEYYISNHTNDDLMVVFRPFYPETVDVLAGPLIPEIEGSVRESLTQPLEVIQNDDILRFTLPAQTTIYLGSVTGGNDLFAYLEVTAKNWQIAMDDDSYDTHFAVHDNFIGAIAHVFEIKP